MASHNLRRSILNPTTFFSREAIVQIIGDMIYYLEKTPQRGTVIIGTALERPGKKAEAHSYGLAIREREDGQVDLYIDTYLQALKRGIFQQPPTDLRKNMLRYLVGAGICVVLFFALLTPLGWLAALTLLVLSPVIVPLTYLKARRQFCRGQKVMLQILSPFESEFKTTDKLDTKDFLGMLPRIKSAVTDIVIP